MVVSGEVDLFAQLKRKGLECSLVVECLALNLMLSTKKKLERDWKQRENLRQVCHTRLKTDGWPHYSYTQ
jgi:hypothetical protein